MDRAENGNGHSLEQILFLIDVRLCSTPETLFTSRNELRFNVFFHCVLSCGMYRAYYNNIGYYVIFMRAVILCRHAVSISNDRSWQRGLCFLSQKSSGKQS